MNFLAIDYGEKRIGLAHGDDELLMPFPLPCANQPSEAERLAAIAAVISRYRIAHLIVGYPINMDGSHGYKTREVDAFIEKLETQFHLPVTRVDETLTSYAAESQLSAKRKGGRNAKAHQNHRKSGEIDSLAAGIILQDFFNSR
ncbi:MAG: Holliday junction resolvase RuvX [Opitutales bacterium]|nr:Holliday junction resolvase RuvX [Opitutales bacterium]